MIFQTGMNPKLAEMAFRSVVNSYTKTATETLASVGLGVGMPIVLETATASSAGWGYFVRAPLTATVVTPDNNLFIGCLDHSLGTNSSYLAGEDVGVAQCYGYDSDALVAGATATIAAGNALIPSIAYLVVCGSPITAAAVTGTTDHGLPFGLGGLAYAISTAATVSATSVTKTPGVFLRCL